MWFAQRCAYQLWFGTTLIFLGITFPLKIFTIIILYAKCVFKQNLCLDIFEYGCLKLNFQRKTWCTPVYTLNIFKRNNGDIFIKRNAQAHNYTKSTKEPIHDIMALSFTNKCLLRNNYTFSICLLPHRSLLSESLFTCHNQKQKFLVKRLVLYNIFTHMYLFMFFFNV